MYGYLPLCVHVHLCVAAEDRGQPQILFLRSYSTCFCEKDSLLETCGFLIQLGWHASESYRDKEELCPTLRGCWELNVSTK